MLIKSKTIQGIKHLWDPCRKSYFPWTPEEEVRQQIIYILSEHFQYPFSKIGVEQQIQVGQRKKRVDIICYNKNTEPFLLIECKAPQIQLNQKVLEQVAHYNFTLRVPFVAISNGPELLVWQYRPEFKKYVSIEMLPHYE